MTDRDIKPENIRSVAVLVDCSVCAGRGKVYASESSRHESPCEDCTGTGEVIAGVSIATLRALLKETP